MSYTVNKILEIARAEIGYKEKASNSQLDDAAANAGSNNWTKYARDLYAAGYYQGNKNGYAWCDVFVDWCFYMLADKNAAKAQEIECQTGLYGAGCSWSAKYYKVQGRLYTSNPQPGDQIFFGTSGNESHTGLVESVNGTTITTIEGNTSNMVARRTYTLGSSNICGFGRPKYDTETATGTTTTPTGSVTGTASTGTAADEKAIWDYLMAYIDNEYGVAGLMGNLYAESALRSNNLQNSYESKLGYTDATYTTAVDNGAYTNFVKDAAGYGLAQWTYYTRKQALLAYAQSKKKSVGDMTTQLEFLYKELNESYKSVLTALKSATSVRSASDVVLTKFERPADQGESVQKKRAEYGQKYYDKYADTSSATTTPATSADLAYKVGDIVQFNGTNHYASANASSGPKVKPCKVKVTSVYKSGKHPYHCRSVNDAGAFIGGVYGWVNAADLTAISSTGASGNASGNTGDSTWAPAVGDTVNYNGTVHYVSANATKAAKCKGGVAKITQIYQLGKSKHPYHLVRVAGKGASVYGWVDAGSFTKA